MNSWLVAAVIIAIYLALAALGQGLEQWNDIRGGFYPEGPKIICSPVTGRTLPVDMWAEYDRRK